MTKELINKIKSHLFYYDQMIADRIDDLDDDTRYNPNNDAYQKVLENRQKDLHILQKQIEEYEKGIDTRSNNA